MDRIKTGPGRSAEDIRVLLASSNRLLRELLTFRLSRSKGLKFLASFDTQEGIARAVRDLTPDVTLIASDHTGMSPGDAKMIGAITAARPRTRLVVIAKRLHPAIASELARIGVSGMVVVSQGWISVADTVRFVHKGGFCAPQSVVATLAGETNGEQRALTPRDVELIAFVARGCSNSDIASLMNISESTVRSRLGGILLRLGVTNRVQAVTETIRLGYIRPEPPRPSGPADSP